jgi:hypothetical protein
VNEQPPNKRMQLTKPAQAMELRRHHRNGVGLAGRAMRVLSSVPLLTVLSLQSAGEEDWHGQVRRFGRARPDVHSGGDVGGGQEAHVEGGGDERAVAGGRGAERSWGCASVLGGGGAERVASRDSLAARERDRGDGAGEEPRAEGRSTGRVGSSGGHSDGACADAGVRGSEASGRFAQRGLREGRRMDTTGRSRPYNDAYLHAYSDEHVS